MHSGQSGQSGPCPYIQRRFVVRGMPGYQSLRCCIVDSYPSHLDDHMRPRCSYSSHCIGLLTHSGSSVRDDAAAESLGAPVRNFVFSQVALTLIVLVLDCAHPRTGAHLLVFAVMAALGVLQHRLAPCDHDRLHSHPAICPGHDLNPLPLIRIHHDIAGEVQVEAGH